MRPRGVDSSRVDQSSLGPGPLVLRSAAVRHVRRFQGTAPQPGRRRFASELPAYFEGGKATSEDATSEEAESKSDFVPFW
jgi:hypothetical protein